MIKHVANKCFDACVYIYTWLELKDRYFCKVLILISDLSRAIDKSVSRAISLLTTPGKSPTTSESPKPDTSVEGESDPVIISGTDLNGDGIGESCFR